MSDVIYILRQTRRVTDTDESMNNIRWLERIADFEVFIRHLDLCEQKTISRSFWEAQAAFLLRYR